MSVQEIISIVRENFFLALIAVIVLGIIFFLGYFIISRKYFREKRKFPRKQLFFWGLFIGYIIMVIGVTFLNRGANYHGGMELSLFSSYREAWNSFSLRHWQFVYLNIFMFVPFGFLFPLLHSRFQKAVWTIGMAAIFTLSIESFQLITGYGIFEADDLFNNLLGAVIGYGIIIGFITIKEKGIKRSFFYFTPLLLVVILSGSMFAYYYLKEFGNLSIMPNQRINMTNTTIDMEIQLDDHRRKVPIYKAPSYTKVAANEFVIDFFNRQHLDTMDMEVISYSDEGVYWIRGERSHNIWFRYLDGSYSYTDFSSHEEGKEPENTDEELLKKKLAIFGIDIPQDSKFQQVDTGLYEWAIDKKVIGNQLIDGSLTVSYYNDDTVKRIDNRLITYDKVRDIQIKSEKEAYKEILDGKFQNYSEKNKMIKTLRIEKVELSYFLDSKGYYQPIYAFHSNIDGMGITIFIPGV